MSGSFRASPWITYEGGNSRSHFPPSSVYPSSHINPSAQIQFSAMSGDVDMGTPQISTLREEETPPPQPTKGKFRVNLLVGEKSASAGPSVKPKKPAAGDSEEEEDEEHDELEEDQLIDDDDDDEGVQLKRPLSVTIPATKPKPRKRPRKSEKVEAKPAESVADSLDAQHSASISDTSPVKPPIKKKVAPKKPAVPKVVKPKIAPKVVKSLAIPQLDDADLVSESNYAGTTASSPAPPDANSPEPEILALSNAMPVDINLELEGIALPIYPLPNKPYPVQPPPKIPTGFAPVIPLDKSTNKPRHWRTANREIRGIAGGRWFARTWVGDKESELAMAAANRDVAAAIIKANSETDKRANSVSISSRGGIELLSATPSVKVSPKPKTIKSQVGISVATSRAGSGKSVLLELETSTYVLSLIVVSDAHAPRAPTKMRNILAGPASEADSDMPGP
ncbi:hypothetical protein HWV62_28836 [Athelia sp. TMB]|nr:hypothetical protein HWV62_44699 [Athelia sp. TMB]KAF7968940.1 hypothetical protein HWV62_28836 [Athelia sp. TMB]